MIDEKTAEKALNYLAETDEPAAKAKSLMLALEKQEKTVLAVSYMNSQGRSVQDREYEARKSIEYLDWQEKYKDAVYEHELYRNKRSRAELTIEFWRSLNANRRQG